MQASCLPSAGRVESNGVGSPANTARAGCGSAAAPARVPSIDDCHIESTGECWYATWGTFNGQGFSRTGAYQVLCADIRRAAA